MTATAEAPAAPSPAPSRTRRVDAVVYDIEIEKCIPDRSQAREPDLQYCHGWDDWRGMGIAVLCAFDTRTRTPHVFLEDNLHDFGELVAGRVVVSYNGQSFDDKLISAHGVRIEQSYDLRLEVLRAAGVGLRTKGYKLEELARANLGTSKLMQGAHAPVRWQRGHRGHVINYCLDDVMKTARLVQLAQIIDPTNGRPLTLAPCGVAA